MITAGVKDNQILEGFEAIAIEKERYETDLALHNLSLIEQNQRLKSADKQVKKR